MSEVRSMNPACSLGAKYLYTKSFFATAFWVTALCISLSLSAILLLYLENTTNRLSSIYLLSGNFDYAGLALVFVVLILFSVIFILRDKNDIVSNQSRSRYIDSYFNLDQIKPDDWKSLPGKFLNIKNPSFKIISDSAEKPICFRYNTTLLPFSEDQISNAECINANCKIRIAIGLIDN